MSRLIPITVPMVLLFAGLSAPAQSGCVGLAGLERAGVTITAVEAIPAGEFTPTGGRGGARSITDLPAFCRVTATLSPTEGSSIGVEIWLPEAASWNGRYLAVGNGGFAGSIGTNALMEPLRRGYAVSGTDTGHTSPGGDFLLDEAPRVDFEHRAVHEMAEESKRLIRQLYGRDEEYAFFNGCSTGGRQALTAAQRYPADFDGIVAGAPAHYASHLQGQQLFMSRVGNAPGGTPLSPAKLALVNEAVIATCDLNDGVADGVIENPPACMFDPNSLVCADNTGDACLTTGEVETLARLYQGPTTAGGVPIFPGSVLGSESGWGQMTGAQPMALAWDIYRYAVFGDPDWSYENFDAARDIPYAAQALGESMDADDPDLSPLVERGGKLLIYHGWADPGITPYSSVDYYGSVLATMGAGARDSVRLFMVPGMGHCGGGEGPSTFDMLREIDDWVTTGRAPQQILASRSRGGQVDRTRPLCPYPEIAVYDGTGSTDLAENFRCTSP
jgi:pimeloyl-ACP methyl ester carboxylesterase